MSLDDLRRDTGLALRSFRREPGFAAGIVLTFALAIGANATMFGIVQRLMLAAPTGVHDAERVARVQLTFSNGDREPYTISSTSWPVFRTVASRDHALEGAAAFRHDTLTIGRGAERAEVAVVMASGDYFRVLGARASLGRLFGPGDDELPSGNPVVVLSHAYWRRAFGGSPDALGREIIVSDEPYTVVGVAERGFNGTELSAVDLFLPFVAAQRGRAPGWWNAAGMRLLSIVVRLAPGVSSQAAGAAIGAALQDDAVATFGDRLVGASLESLAPGAATRSAPNARIALWLSGIALVVLLNAAANVGTLLLLRAARRRREIAVRVALGAARTRLGRQILTDSLVLALVGGMAGLLLAYWLGDVVRATLLPQLAPSDHVVDVPLLLAALAGSLFTGFVAGLVPLMQLGRGDLTRALRAGGHGASGRFAAQHALVAVQVALCTVLLVGAGLFVRSLDRVQSQDLGFSTARLLRVTLEFQQRPPAYERDLAHVEAARRLASVPGVTAATVVQGMPFSSHHIPPISVPGVDVLSFGSGQPPIMYGATPAYLEMMGVTLVAGRLLTDRDTRASAPVVLVNESMARNLWPGESALGKCVRAGHPPGEPDPDGFGDLAASLPCREVVGVVRDSRARSLRAVRDEARLMQYYVPFEQLPRPPFPDVAEVHALLVQTAGDAREHAAEVQRAIQGSSSRPVYARVQPYQDLIDPQLRSWRLGATVFSAFGLLALGIAAVGLYGVIAYLVSQRIREIGVRLALGGPRVSIGALVVRDAVRMTGIGAAAGIAIAMVAAPLVQSMLYETSAREPRVAGAAAGILLVVAVCAAAVPAWRATLVSPMQALRAE